MNRIVAASVLAVALSLALPLVPAGDAAAQPRHSERDRRGDRDRDRAPPRRYPAIGESVRVLPSARVAVRVGRDRFYFHAGSFYRLGPRNSYVVVRAPIGARLRVLPPGYVSFYLGTRRYFYLNFTYYLWNPAVSEYVVVEKPEGADAAVAAVGESATGKLFIYPNNGQSDAQRDKDRYECYQWAVQQTGFDPSDANGASDQAADYRRAFTACLEGRGYTVK